MAVVGVEPTSPAYETDDLPIVLTAILRERIELSLGLHQSPVLPLNDLSVKRR